MARKKKQQAPDDDVRVVPVEKIRTDGGTQVRVDDADKEDLEKFAETYRTKPSVMPALECVYDERADCYWLWDGFGRFAGLKLAGMTHARVRFAVGTLGMARRLAGGANKDQHARPLKNKDKRRAVEVVFSSDETRGMSDSAIASICGVGYSLVADVRRALSAGGRLPDSGSRTGLDGRTIDTSKIGKPKAEPETPAPMPWDLVARPEEDEAPDYEPPALTEQEQQEIGEQFIRDAHAEPPPPARKPKPKPEKPRQEEVRDAVGNLVPSRLRDVFADAKLSAELARVRAWRQAVEHASFHRNLGAVEAHYRPWLKPGVANEAAAEAHAQLTAAEQHVERALPYALCPHCLETAGGCDSCRGTGWVPRWRYQELEAHARLENGVNSAGGKGAS